MRDRWTPIVDSGRPTTVLERNSLLRNKELLLTGQAAMVRSTCLAARAPGRHRGPAAEFQVVRPHEGLIVHTDRET